MLVTGSEPDQRRASLVQPHPEGASARGAAQMLGTPRRQMLQEIVLLGALPYIVVGLRTAVSISFYTLVAAELAGSFAGIVYRIEIAQQNLQTGQAMGGLLVLGAISFAADRSFAALSQRLVRWR